MSLVEHNVQVVLEIVNIVVGDPLMTQESRMIKPFQNTLGCSRKKKSTSDAFKSLSRTLLQAHASHGCNFVTLSSQVGQVLTQTLVENAMMDEILPKNFKINLSITPRNAIERNETSEGRTNFSRCKVL